MLAAPQFMVTGNRFDTTVATNRDFVRYREQSVCRRRFGRRPLLIGNPRGAPMTIQAAKTQAVALPSRPSLRIHLAMAALAAALLAAPNLAHAQGVIGGMERGAHQGSREGNRAAGPIGGAVGGAIGAGVGGVVGGVKGVLGIPDRGPYRGKRCRGYYDRHHHFHCYRRR
jgi:hypothetical protein